MTEPIKSMALQGISGVTVHFPGERRAPMTRTDKWFHVGLVNSKRKPRTRRMWDHGAAASNGDRM